MGFFVLYLGVVQLVERLFWEQEGALRHRRFESYHLDRRPFGTCWITNGCENKKIKKTEVIPSGWKLGRNLN